MQQSSATQSLHLSFWGLQKIVAYSHSSSQCLLVSTVFGTVSSLHLTSFLYANNYSFTLHAYNHDIFLLCRYCGSSGGAVLSYCCRSFHSSVCSMGMQKLEMRVLFLMISYLLTRMRMRTALGVLYQC